MITLGLVDSVDDNGVYVTMPGSRGVLRGPYSATQTVVAGERVLVTTTDDGESVIAGVVDQGGAVSVTAFGATGDGVTDDSVSIRAAIAAVGAGGTVFFPDGTYIVSRSDDDSGSINLTHSVTLIGEQGATLKMADGQPTHTRVFRITADDVTIRGLCIDGNSANQSVEVNEQRHGISCADVERTLISGCIIRDCAGDGIHFNTSTDTTVSDTVISGCDRNGITLYATSGALSGARISDNTISAEVQPIDAEPSPTGTVDDVQIVGNRLTSVGGNYAITVSDANRWTVSGNQLVGSLLVTRAYDVTITGNVIDASDTVTDYAVRAFYESRDVTLTSNVIVAAAAQPAIKIATSSASTPANWTLVGNIIKVSGAVGVDASGVDNVSIIGNRVVGDDTGSASGVYVRATVDVGSAIVVANDVIGFKYGVVVTTYSTYTLSSAIVQGNRVSNPFSTPDATTGIWVTTSDAAQLPSVVVSGNTVDSVYTDAIVEDPAGDILRHGFFATAADVVKPEVTGSRGGNAALASLLTALADLGLITDSSS